MAYQGKDEQLIDYQKGESETIVRPEKDNLSVRLVKIIVYINMVYQGVAINIIN